MSAARNAVGPDIKTSDRADELEKAANAFLETEITTAELAAKAVDHDTQLMRAIQAADAQRDFERKPHLTEAAKIQEAWRPLIDRLTICRRLIGDKLRGWKLAEQKRIDEERAEAKRKADEAVRKAAEAAKAAAVPKSVADITNAERLAKEATAAQEAIGALPARAQVRGAQSGRATSLRAHWSAEIEDIVEVFVHFQDREEVRECLQKLANAAVRGMEGDQRTLPGCKCVKEMK